MSFFQEEPQVDNQSDRFTIKTFQNYPSIGMRLGVISRSLFDDTKELKNIIMRTKYMDKYIDRNISRNYDRNVNLERNINIERNINNFKSLSNSKTINNPNNSNNFNKENNSNSPNNFNENKSKNENNENNLSKNIKIESCDELPNPNHIKIELSDSPLNICMARNLNITNMTNVTNMTNMTNMANANSDDTNEDPLLGSESDININNYDYDYGYNPYNGYNGYGGYNYNNNSNNNNYSCERMRMRMKDELKDEDILNLILSKPYKHSYDEYLYKQEQEQEYFQGDNNIDKIEKIDKNTNKNIKDKNIDEKNIDEKNIDNKNIDDKNINEKNNTELSKNNGNTSGSGRYNSFSNYNCNTSEESHLQNVDLQNHQTNSNGSGSGNGSGKKAPRKLFMLPSEAIIDLEKVLHEINNLNSCMNANKLIKEEYLNLIHNSEGMIKFFIINSL